MAWMPPEAPPRSQLLWMCESKHRAYTLYLSPVLQHRWAALSTWAVNHNSHKLAKHWDPPFKPSCHLKFTKIRNCWGDSVILHFSKWLTTGFLQMVFLVHWTHNSICTINVSARCLFHKTVCGCASWTPILEDRGGYKRLGACFPLPIISRLHLETQVLSPFPTFQPWTANCLSVNLSLRNTEVTSTFAKAGVRIKTATEMWILITHRTKSWYVGSVHNLGQTP